MCNSCKLKEFQKVHLLPEEQRFRCSVTLSKADVYYTCKSRSYLRAAVGANHRIVYQRKWSLFSLLHLLPPTPWKSNLSCLRLRLAGRIWPVTCTSSPKWTVTNMCQLWRWPTWTTSKSSARTWSWLWTSYDVSEMLSKSQFYAPVIFLGVQSELVIVLVYLNELHVKKTLSEWISISMWLELISQERSLKCIQQSLTYLCLICART